MVIDIERIHNYKYNVENMATLAPSWWNLVPAPICVRLEAAAQRPVFPFLPFTMFEFW